MISTKNANHQLAKYIKYKFGCDKNKYENLQYEKTLIILQFVFLFFRHTTLSG